MKDYICKSKIGPYDGPYKKNIITYIFENNLERIAWHSTTIEDPKFELLKIYSGILTFYKNNNLIINYKKSKPFKKQLELL
jgi:hypothetical protein